MKHELIGKKFPLLDDGFICLMDYMGSDEDIEQAARVSYGKGTRKVSDTRHLLRYLMRHHHCYHEDMEVLTIDGWKCWKDCNSSETFIVPHSSSNSLQFETLDVKSFDYDGDLNCFENNRMSYNVTPNHDLYFKGKYEKKYSKVKADKVKQWGHYRGVQGFTMFNDSDGELYTASKELREDEFQLARLVGFFLGDGYWITNTKIGFRLQKERKVKYLQELISELSIKYKHTESIEDGDIVHNYEFEFDYLHMFTNIKGKANNKKLYLPKLENLSTEILDGLFDGLVNSDGSYKSDRPQIEFSSTSKDLIDKIQVLSALKGYDAHEVKSFDDCYRVNIYYGERTSLEARKQYHHTKKYKGKVYCTTTKSGLLLVRGKNTEFAHISGNSTPFEMAEVKLLIRCPLYVVRQWHRHRTWSYNEYSGRYSVMIDSMHKTQADEWRTQSITNKQGSGGYIEGNVESYDKAPFPHSPFGTYRTMASVMNRYGTIDKGEYLTHIERELHEKSDAVYQERLELGVAKEQARKDLPVSNYTEFFAKVDLKNLMHFMSLRCDSHAQYEIRVYADKIAGMVKELYPITFGAWYDYHFKAVNFTRLDRIMLQHYFGTCDMVAKAEEIGMSKREYTEFLDKIKVPEEKDFSL